jgi:hypothetical protein
LCVLLVVLPSSDSDRRNIEDDDEHTYFARPVSL